MAQISWKIHRSTWLALALLALCALVLAVLGVSGVHDIFLEQGIVENATIIFWLLAAVLPWRYLGERRITAWMFSLLFLLFAMREADMHRMFTSEGMMKLSFYTHHAWTSEQWISLPFALAAVSVIAACALILVRYLVTGGWRFASGQLLLIGGGVMIAAKVMDRLPAVLKNDFGTIVTPHLQQVLLALEEGLEMISPLVFVWALLIVPNILTRAQKSLSVAD